MSSTVSQTEMQSVPREEVTELTGKEDGPQTSTPLQQQRPPLIRSSSVDKIIKFNAYICSQNYYILPSLLMWLKTSQNALSHQTEKSIVFVKSAFFAAILYKIVFAASGTCRSCLACLRAARYLCFERVPRAFVALVLLLRERLAVIAVYTSLAIIALQLFSCVLILCSVFVPNGFIFMVCCMYVMGHIAASAMFHYIKQEGRKDRAEGCRTKTVAKTSAKTLLGNRTISNVNFF